MELASWRLNRRDSPGRLDRGFTVRDGNDISARWPGDCHRLAAEFVELVREHAAARSAAEPTV